MTPSEQAAFEKGIATMADVARRAADEMRRRAVRAPLRYERAIEALDALVDEAAGFRSMSHAPAN